MSLVPRQRQIQLVSATMSQTCRRCVDASASRSILSLNPGNCFAAAEQHTYCHRGGVLCASVRTACSIIIAVATSVITATAAASVAAATAAATAVATAATTAAAATDILRSCSGGCCSGLCDGWGCRHDDHSPHVAGEERSVLGAPTALRQLTLYWPQQLQYVASNACECNSVSLSWC